MLSRSHAHPTLTVNLARFTTGSGSENRSHYAGSARIGYLVIRAFSNLRYSMLRDHQYVRPTHVTACDMEMHMHSFVACSTTMLLQTLALTVKP